MPLTTMPAVADPEIAAITFQTHLDALWKGGRPAKLGWERSKVDDLHTVVKLPAKRPTGEVDHYHFRLGAEYYDAAPPTVTLVLADGVTPSPQNSHDFPVLTPPPWFHLHPAYTYPNGQQRQLVCFSFAAEFYMTQHSPKESEMWQQGRHTVAATLYRLAEILSPHYYRQPAA